MSKELKETLEREEKVRRKAKEKGESIRHYSWVPFFAGEEFNQEILNYQEIKNRINPIDFDKLRGNSGEKIEERIKEIYDNDKNKQFVDNGEYPIIWFKNIEKIESNSALEKALLPIFDPQQNTELFNNGTDLSKYVLIATSSTRDMGQLSLPLTSRLDCINVKTAKPRQFFLDKHFTGILVGSVLLVIILGLLTFFPNKKKEQEEVK